MMLKMPMSGRSSLVVQWLRLCAPNAGGPGSIPAQGTRFCLPQLKIPHTTNTSAQPKNNLKKKKMPREGGIYFIPTLKTFFSTLLKVKWISWILQMLCSKYIKQRARICSWREILKTTLSMEKNLHTTRWKKTSHAINKEKLERITKNPLGCQVQGRRSWSDTLCLVIPFYLG